MMCTFRESDSDDDRVESSPSYLVNDSDHLLHRLDSHVGGSSSRIQQLMHENLCFFVFNRNVGIVRAGVIQDMTKRPRVSSGFAY
jgi:hypothetical protein